MSGLNLSAYSGKNLKLKWISQSFNLPRSSEDYRVLYERSGLGFLSSFQLNFGSFDISLKLEIDGNTVFDIDCEELENWFVSYDGFSGEITLINSPDKFIFTPKFAIKYKESIRISARSNDNGSWKDFRGGTIMQEEY